MLLLTAVAVAVALCSRGCVWVCNFYFVMWSFASMVFLKYGQYNQSINDSLNKIETATVLTQTTNASKNRIDMRTTFQTSYTFKQKLIEPQQNWSVQNKTDPFLWILLLFYLLVVEWTNWRIITTFKLPL